SETVSHCHGVPKGSEGPLWNASRISIQAGVVVLRPGVCPAGYDATGNPCARAPRARSGALFIGGLLCSSRPLPRGRNRVSQGNRSECKERVISLRHRAGTQETGKRPGG